MTVSSLVVKIGADISELQSAMGKVQKSVENTGKRMTALGKTISTRVTAPLTALGGVAVRAFGIQEKAELQLRAALQANGREVDRLFKRYNDFAQEMQRLTIVGDETTLAMLSQAESLGLTADSAERAVKNSIAMQSAFGVNAQSALRYTAALEQGNATMLTRYIPTLREIEDESERVAEAQRILGNAFSAAEAEAQGSTGQMIQMKNAVGDLLEVVGEVIAEAILPFVRRVKEMAEAAQTVDRSIIKMTVTIAGLAAAIGPALIIIGQLIRAFGLVLTPIFAKIAAITGLVVAFEYVRRNLDVFINRIRRGFAKIRNIVIQEVDRILEAIQGWARWLPGHMDLAIVQARASMLSLSGDIPEIEGEFQSMGEFIGDVVSDIGDGFRWLSNIVFPESVRSLEDVNIAFRDLGESMIVPIRRAVKVSADGARSLRDIVGGVRDDVVEMSDALQTAITSAGTSFAESIGQMIASGGDGQSFFNNMLTLMSDFAVQFGRIVMAMGVAALQLKQLFANPIAAIAAGAALIALGTAARSLISAGPGGSSGAVSQNFSPAASGSAVADRQRVEVFGKLKGEDIHISSSQGENTFNR